MVYKEGSIKQRDSVQWMTSATPEGDKVRFSAHSVNRTKGEVEEVNFATLSDRGDHYFLHEIRVAEPFRNFGYMKDAFQSVIFYLGDKLSQYDSSTPTKPIRTLARVQEGMSQANLVKVLESWGFEELEKADGGVLMEWEWDNYDRVFR